MDARIYFDAVDALEEFEGTAVVSDFEIKVVLDDGHSFAPVDVIKLVNTWDGGTRFEFYSGRPDLDGTDEEGDWDELDLTDEQQELVLREMLLYI